MSATQRYSNLFISEQPLANLRDITPLDSLPSGALWQHIGRLQRSNRQKDRFLGILLNAIFTEMRSVFPLSQVSLRGLICSVPKEEGRPLRGIDGHDLGDFRKIILKRGVLVQLRAPARGRPGLYELADANLLEDFDAMLMAKTREANRAEVIKAYDAKFPADQSVAPEAPDKAPPEAPPKAPPSSLTNTSPSSQVEQKEKNRPSHGAGTDPKWQLALLALRKNSPLRCSPAERFQLMRDLVATVKSAGIGIEGLGIEQETEVASVFVPVLNEKTKAAHAHVISDWRKAIADASEAELESAPLDEWDEGAAVLHASRAKQRSCQPVPAAGGREAP